ncbi:lipocalin family protein [Mangrovimonas sp. YM274]|uniref:lipocalin family protein n=1 Tax=Mangrovimonas sp. YM274 TaxID=3070660 RepID=UPI0027DD376A|nr:lipocalin family protein [Mangrovimonas sp. YM274]WMI67804.1 hypothetical protein RBH95_11705 [Mangrovimonas sp. YM274]
MKSKLFLTVVACFTLLHCGKNPESSLQHLNGYWEIKEVTLADGSKKEYTFSNTIDYIEVNDSLVGFRKKLTPTLEGKFKTSGDAENIKAIIQNDSLILEYKTPYSSWKETVLKATEDKLLILNSRKDLYLYSRYEPLERMD